MHDMWRNLSKIVFRPQTRYVCKVKRAQGNTDIVIGRMDAEDAHRAFILTWTEELAISDQRGARTSLDMTCCTHQERARISTVRLLFSLAGSLPCSPLIAAPVGS